MNLPSKKLVTRFAPSPTGYLHLGHVLSLAYVFGFANRFGAAFLLRMEDHDRQRCRKEYEQAIIDDIAWLGLIPHNWAEWAQQRAPNIYRQSDRLERYQEVLQGLHYRGMLYHCSCSRKQMEPSVSGGQELFYPGRCRDKALNVHEARSIRLKVDPGVFTCDDLLIGRLEQEPALQCGDYLVQDNNGNYTYNFAVAIDDMDQGVNLVIRGQDLVHCVGRQIQLMQLLGRQDAPVYGHHKLLVDEEGRKLSKRWLADGVMRRRLEGDLPEHVLGDALWLGGLLPQPRPVAPHELADLCFNGG